MRSRIALISLLAVVLMIPAVPAYGAEQDVDVQVYPANVLGIEVQDQIGFGLVVGQAATQPFWMQILNSTEGGWQVTVDGADLQSYDWQYCDEWGCHDRVPTDPVSTIDKSNVVVTGGDFCWGDCDPATDDVITKYSQALGAEPALIMEGTVEAWGPFGVGPPYDPSVQLSIPAEAAPNQYWTTLTYTIMGS
ncbi:MAG: hypothetical protein WEC14_09775 [Chloroflexota bacterium]